MPESSAPSRMKRLAAASAALLICGLSAAAPVKLKVTYPAGAPVYKEPRLAGEALTKLPLDRIVDGEEKKGKFWKVSVPVNGVSTPGYLHEAMVMEVGEGEAAGTAAAGSANTQTDLAAEINYDFEQAREMIRLQKDLSLAVDKLRAAAAKTTGLEDHQARKDKACAILLWTGHAFFHLDDQAAALREYQNMFESDYATAKKGIENVPDPDMYRLIAVAEKMHKGEFAGYSVKVETEPQDAVVKVDGQVKGRSPVDFAASSPRIVVDIQKEGYKPLRAPITLKEGTTPARFVLERDGRAVSVNSRPPGAAVVLDGADTGKVTDCELPIVPFGTRAVTLRKEHYADWSETIDVVDGGSPLVLSAVLMAKDYDPARSWGGPERKVFIFPQAVVLDSSGNIYVADDGKQKLRKFNADGVFQKMWGGGGQHFKRLKRPAGLAIDTKGNIYVTDSMAGNVTVFDKNGQPTKSWGKPGSRTGELNQPQGVAIDRNNDILVIDQGNCRVVRYSPDGTVKKTWGGKAPDKGQFSKPAGVAVCPNNEIIVSDAGGILRFDPEGLFLGVCGKAGAGEGELRTPAGVATDVDGAIYVADSGNNCVLKFDPRGRFVCQWGKTGNAVGQFIMPNALAVDEKGSVFVLERGNHRLQVFTAAGK